MRKHFLLALLGGIAGGSFASGAANASTDDPIGGYFGIGLTKPKVDNVYGDGLNIEKTSWKAMAGISQGGFAFEGDYYRLGSLTTADTHIEARAVAGYAVLSVPISKVTLLGKVGMARWQMSGDLGGLFSFDTHGYAFAWGGGAQFKYNRFTARLEYERFNVVNTDGAVVYGLSLIFNL